MPRRRCPPRLARSRLQPARAQPPAGGARHRLGARRSRPIRASTSFSRLPGVGPYTARAVAALAFGQAVGPVDTNVRRVLGRLVGADGAASVRELQSIADRSVPPARPADWTHALMDLGATVCRPNAPRCAECPAARWCRSATRVTRRVRRGDAAAGAPFASTSRWLRGRILDQLRDVPDDDWGAVVGPIGEHEERAVDTALLAMESEGLIERDLAEPGRVRLAR